ncbi:transposase [Rhodohalobacter sp.]|uniref:transposase n=1 Tax=Rhodohalobacter sp. TaxID=1974210 RepID=UPI002ACD6F65|nr:transposase [Rhodohalobacter sp.]
MPKAPTVKKALQGRKPDKTLLMPQSLSKVYTHIIFSTKHRKNLIDNRIEKDLYNYVGGICKELECNPVQVGGHKNHIHLLCLLSRKVAQMTLVQQIKQGSSKWIKTMGKSYSDFYWSRKLSGDMEFSQYLQNTLIL